MKEIHEATILIALWGLATIGSVAQIWFVISGISEPGQVFWPPIALMAIAVMMEFFVFDWPEVTHDG